MGGCKMIDKIKNRLDKYNKMPYEYIPRQDLLKIIELQAEALDAITKVDYDQDDIFRMIAISREALEKTAKLLGVE
jgi:uncharacterized protein Yka (UPF0111/DUF47 family)